MDNEDVIVHPRWINLEPDAVNALCLKCTQTCKQSNKVHVHKCGYKPKKGV